MASSRGVSSETGGRHRSMDLDGSGLPSVGDILDSPESSTSSSAAAKAGALQPGQSRSLGSRRSRGNKWPFPAGMSSRSPSRHHDDGDVVWEKDGAGKARPTQQQQQQHQTGSGLRAVASPMRARSRTPVPAPAAAGSQATSASSAAPAASAGQAACSSTAACPPTASQPQTARPPLGRSDSRARSAESRYSRARQDASTLFSDSPPSGASSSENDRLLISLMRDPPRTIQGRGLGGNSSAGGTISFGSEGRAASADGSGVTGGGATSSGIGGGPRRLNEDAASSAWSRNRLVNAREQAAAFAPSSMAWEPSTPMGDAMPMSPPPPYDPAHRRADRAPLYSDGRRHAATSAASVPPLNLERARQNRVGVDESIDGEEYQPSEGPADSLPASQLPHLNLTDGHYSLQFPMQLRPDTTPLGQRDRQRPAQRGIMPPANTAATPRWLAGPVDPQGSMQMTGGGCSDGPVHQPHMQAPHMQAPIQPQQSQQHGMQRVSDGLMPPRDATSGQGPVPAAGFPGGPPGHPSQFPASHPPVHSSFGGGITGLASKMVSAVGQVLGGAGPMPPPLRSTQDGTMPSSMSSGGTAGPSAVPPPPPSQNVPQQHQQHQQQQEHQQEQQVQPQQLGGSEGDADVTKTAGNASAASIAPAEEVVWDSQTGTGGGSEPAGQAAPLADADGDVAMGGALVGAQVGGDGESGGGASIAGDAPRNGRRSLGGVSEAAASATETVQSTVSMAVVGVSGEGETVEGFQATETTTVVASVDAAVGSGEGASGHGLGEDPSHASFGGDDSAGFEDPAHVSFGGVQSSPPRTPEVHPSEPARPEMAEMGQQTTPEKPLLEGTEAEATAKRKQLVRRPRGHLSPPPREGSTQLVELGLDAFGRYPASKRPRRNYIPPLKHWKGEQVVYRREPGSEMPTVHGVRMAAEVKADGSLSQPKIPLKPIREGSFARMPLADDPCRLSNASAAPPTPSTSCGSSPGDFEPGSERGTTSSSEEEEVGVSLDKLEKDVRKPQPQAHDGAAHRKRRNKRSRSLGSIREVPAEEDMEPRTLFEEPDQQEEEKEKEEEEEEANSSSSTSKMEKRTPKPKPPAAETGAASKKKEKKPTRSRSLGSVRERKKEGRAPARVQPLPPPPSPPRFDDADYEKEGYFVLPVAEGSAKPLGLKVCLDTGLMLVCNILIPPSSWNQEEPLNEGKTMILSVIKGMANTLVCTVGSEDVTLGAGDNIVIQPGVNYRLRNSSDHHIVLAKMILVSSKSDAEDGGDGGDERGMMLIEVSPVGEAEIVKAAAHLDDS
eukprot:CAMPEP_0206528226 /NCGR_PEP_ID=MMETSP0325_2-20121206/1832_1 /ASSEMBLY_ACC=CAM_ASM_000347 /TAXON_ID=2866 /ORGANISM="Crypthecodinium cohnii, Strain Seligo" /LENGTH=1288 /DNA_ID=CAMNT_0054023815 /DNA_START=198 /DNA_END=4066 /DNA_ORIENTATION=-